MPRSSCSKACARKFVAGLIAWCLAVQPSAAAAGSPATVMVAPNLMIVLSTSYSMNRLLSDTGYPALVPASASSSGNMYAMNDPYNPGAGNPSGHLDGPVNAYGDMPGSKLYQAKLALQTILHSPQSDRINVGFATYRMIYGQVLVAGSITTSAGVAARPQPADPAIFSQDTQTKTQYAANPEHFVSVSWWPLRYLGYPAGSACDTLARSQWPAGNYINGLSNAGAALLGNGICAGTVGLTDTTAAQWLPAVPDGYGFAGGGLPTWVQASGGPGYYLCSLSYNSQANTFAAGYGSDTVMSQAESYVAALGMGNFLSPEGTSMRLTKGSHAPCPLAQSNIAVPAAVTAAIAANLPARTVTNPDGTQTSIPAGDAYGWGPQVQATNGNDWPSEGAAYSAPADVAGQIAAYARTGVYGEYQAGVPGAQDGVLSGWSGETSYTCVDRNGAPAANRCVQPPDQGGSAQYSEQVGAHYPSGPADPDGPQRRLETGVSMFSATGLTRQTAASLAAGGGMQNMAAQLASQIHHMGPFVDLPEPQVGYADQRVLIDRLLGVVQMRNDGADYDPASQTMAPVTLANVSGRPPSGHYGVSISGYDGAAGSPVYDTLEDAYAYYKSYEAQDPYVKCRSNNLLLVIDGKEDARYWIQNGQTTYASPANVAARLDKDLNVKVWVIIMSTSAGDVQQANAIAQNGGTGQAYQTADPTALLASLGSVFSALSGQINTQSVAAPVGSHGNGVLYATADSLSPTQGHVYAYPLSGNGLPGTLPLWDAATLESVLMRGNALWSTGPQSTGAVGSGLPVLLTQLDAAAFALAPSSPLTVQSIVDYTLNPSWPCTVNCGSDPVASPYLDGRAPGAYLGEMNLVQSAVLLDPPSSNQLLREYPSYAVWAQGEASRLPLVLASSQDGFLYAFYQDGDVSGATDLSGQLAWGWMPREFVQFLQDYTRFPASHYGNGALTVVDALDGNNRWATYLAGTLASGATHYALRLAANGRPAAVVFDDWRPGGASIALTAPATIMAGGTTCVLYLVNAVGQGSVTPTLVVRQIDTGGEPMGEAALPFTPASNLFVLGGMLYVGDASGNLWCAPLTDSSGSRLVPAIHFSQVGSFYDASAAGDSDHVIQFVGGILNGNLPWIYAQSTSRVTVFNQETGGTWLRDWTSFDGGAGTWNPQGSYTPSTLGVVPAGQAVPATGVQWLPAATTTMGAAQISGNSTIVSNSLIVPVTMTDAAQACSAGNAYDYLFSLQNGQFPLGAFTFLQPSSGMPDGTATTAASVTGNVYVGLGTAYAATATLNSDVLDVYSASEQSNAANGQTHGTGACLTCAFQSAQPQVSLIWWRILNN